MSTMSWWWPSLDELDEALAQLRRGVDVDLTADVQDRVVTLRCGGPG
jgi:hypothetical protein